jgi:hypothetical protein
MNPSSKRVFVISWAVWGALTALAMILFDWHSNHHLDALHIVGHIVIFVVVGGIYGLVLYRYPVMTGASLLNRIPSVVQTILFFGLMLGLAYTLWIMWHRAE